MSRQGIDRGRSVAAGPGCLPLSPTPPASPPPPAENRCRPGGQRSDLAFTTGRLPYAQVRGCARRRTRAWPPCRAVQRGAQGTPQPDHTRCAPLSLCRAPVPRSQA